MSRQRIVAPGSHRLRHRFVGSLRPLLSEDLAANVRGTVHRSGVDLAASKTSSSPSPTPTQKLRPRGRLGLRARGSPCDVPALQMIAVAVGAAIRITAAMTYRPSQPTSVIAGGVDSESNIRGTTRPPRAWCAGRSSIASRPAAIWP